MRAAIYSRVSTTDQTTSPQIDELRSYCGRRQWDIAGEYTDVGISGAENSRLGLNRLLADAKRRKFDAVLVYRYDRFARSLRQLVTALCEFEALGIQFVSVHEGVDTSTPNGRLVFGIFASIAEFERELIRTRVKSGMAAAKARGQHMGRPKVQVQAQEIVLLRTRGLSWAAISKQTGIARTTLQRAVGPPKRVSEAAPASD